MGKKEIKIKYAYCAYCKKEIEHPKRRPLDELEKTVWVIIILSTLGFALPVFLLYLKYVRKRDTCPTCKALLDFSEKPYEKPKELTDKSKEEKEKQQTKDKSEEEEKQIYCPFCGHALTPPVDSCPYCQTTIDR